MSPESASSSSSASTLSTKNLEKLFTAISFAVDINHNPDLLEAPFYNVWNLVLTSLFPCTSTSPLTVAPQWLFVRQVLTNDDKKITERCIPDFVMLRPTAERDTEKKYLWTVQHQRPILILEVKPPNSKRKGPVTASRNNTNDDWWKEDTVNGRELFFESGFLDATTQVLRQAQFAFDTTDTPRVIAMVCVGYRWSYIKFERSDVSGLSVNEDTTFKPIFKEVRPKKLRYYELGKKESDAELQEIKKVLEKDQSGGLTH